MYDLVTSVAVRHGLYLYSELNESFLSWKLMQMVKVIHFQEKISI